MSRSISKFAEKLFEDGRGILSEKLDDLGVHGHDLRMRAERAYELSTRVYALEVAGVDVSVEKEALRSSRDSLVAAAGLAVLVAIRDTVEEVARKTIITTLRFLF